MGNCLECSKTATAEETLETANEDNKIECASSAAAAPPTNKKKTVRFKLGDDVSDGGAGGSKGSAVMRLRIILTTQELNQILNSSEDCMSLDRLLDMVRTSRRSGGCGGGSGDIAIRSWCPSLESILEDH